MNSRLFLWSVVSALAGFLFETQPCMPPPIATPITIYRDVASLAAVIADFKTKVAAPAPLREGKIDLPVFTDRTAYEVFAAAGLTYVPLPCVPNTTALGAEVSVTGGDVTFEKLEVHELRSIWTKP